MNKWQVVGLVAMIAVFMVVVSMIVDFLPVPIDWLFECYDGTG